MEQNFYEILGITEEERQLPSDKFQDVIRKKYKKLAIKWHPDKFATKSENERKEAEDKFKKISEAYNTLSDESKRQQYDYSNGYGPEMERDPFADIFGNMFNRGRGRKVVRNGNNVVVDIDLSLKDAFNGKVVEVEYEKEVKCHHCNGTGSSDGVKHKCHHCNGNGFTETATRQGNTTYITRNACPYCNGTGEETANPCPNCNGTGFETIKEKKTIDIPKGVFDDSAWPFQYEGSESPDDGGMNGDLVFHFNVDNYDQDMQIRRDGDDLIKDIYVPISDALLGCKQEIENIDGEKFTLELPEITKDGDTFTFQGRGMVSIRDGKRGNLYVRVNYFYPYQLSNKQKELLKKFGKK